jgi:nucleotide-binding universal stress UspA family protein
VAEYLARAQRAGVLDYRFDREPGGAQGAGAGPVLRGELPVPPRKVLLPVDLSAISSEVVRRGLALLDEWCGTGRRDGDAGSGQPAGSAAVEALQVVAPVRYEGFVPHYDLEGTERAAAERLGGFLASAGCEGRQIPRQACFGVPREQILQYMATTSPDLVIMGTHGRGGFERLMVGSVTQSVVRSGAASILVIPPLAAAPAPPPWPWPPEVAAGLGGRPRRLRCRALGPGRARPSALGNPPRGVSRRGGHPAHPVAAVQAGPPRLRGRPGLLLGLGGGRVGPARGSTPRRRPRCCSL